MVSSTLCPAVNISGSLNVYSREKGIAEHYWSRAVFYHLLLTATIFALLLLTTVWQCGSHHPNFMSLLSGDVGDVSVVIGDCRVRGGGSRNYIKIEVCMCEAEQGYNASHMYSQ